MGLLIFEMLPSPNPNWVQNSVNEEYCGNGKGVTLIILPKVEVNGHFSFFDFLFEFE